MVKDLGFRRRRALWWRGLAAVIALLLPALAVAIPVMDQDLAIRDLAMAAPDTPGRYFHDHEAICLTMEASQPLVSGAVTAHLPELPVVAVVIHPIARTPRAAHRDRPRSRSPPRI